jgi:LacI family transcriptional regulator
MSASPVRIGLVFDHSLGYNRAVLRGIKSYAEARPNWLLTLVPAEPAAVKRLRALAPAGLIAYVFTRALARGLLSLGRPLVNVSAIVPDVPAHRVVVDDRMVGRMAADHLLARGLAHFGFVGHAALAFSGLREEGFRAALQAAGFEPACFRERGLPPAHLNSLVWPLGGRLRKWLAALPRPVGIFVSNDIWGYQISEVCREMGLIVPDEVALIVVQVDELVSELARPPLTSIAVPAERIGAAAAGLLDGLLGRPRARPLDLLLPPLGIVTRQSTDVVAVDDPDVAAAVRFIRERALARIQVDDVVQALPVTRRALERRFRVSLNRGIAEEIRHVRIERAIYLLASTSSSIAEVARRAGVADAEHFASAFRRHTGLTPSAFRRRYRILGHGAGRG